MRDILFRGFAQIEELTPPQDECSCITIDGMRIYGKWIFGDLKVSLGVPRIFQRGINAWTKVIPETVGQYVGVEDRNDDLIFEHDKVKGDNGNEFRVVWHLCGFRAAINTPWYIDYCTLYDHDCSIIGTIFDPE